MIWLYRILFLPALLVALPYYSLRMWRRGGYGKDFQHRFGRFRRLSPPASGKARIWIQAVSVGEVLAVEALVDGLNESGRCEVVLTTTTSTGYREARKRYAEKVLAVGVFPLDFWLFSRTAWGRIRPDAVVLTESELWPEHLHRARRNGVPALLVNARLSKRSFAYYRRVPALSARLLGHFDRILASSEPDAQRLLRLGASADRLSCCGNLKFDVAAGQPPDAAAREALRAGLGFPATADGGPFVLLGSSTWPGEEEALLRCRSHLVAAGVDCRLLLVPRHAERGPELRALLERQENLRWFQRSTGGRPEAGLEVHLADTTGELTRLTAAADLAFIGKSLPPNDGGQTPIEAAALGVPVLFGPAMSNFRTVAGSLLKAGAAWRVSDAAGLTATVESLVADSDARKRMAAAGTRWHADNRGSSRRTAEAVLDVLSASQAKS